jgi:chromate reductase
MGASPGRFGSVRAQYHLRQCFVFLNGLVMSRPEVMIGGAPQMFDDQLRLTDQPTREIIGKLLVSLVDWTHRCRA